MRRVFFASLTVGVLLLIAEQPRAGAGALDSNQLPFKVAYIGGIAGTVVDAAGAPVAGATVRCTNLATGVVLTQKTDAMGRYNWSKFVVGSYRVEVAVPGFGEATATVEVTKGGMTQSRIVLRINKTAGSAVLHPAGPPPPPPEPPKSIPMPRHDHAHLPTDNPAPTPSQASSPDIKVEPPSQAAPAESGKGAQASADHPAKSDSGGDYLAWLAKLPYGQIQDSINSQMYLNTASEVTVTIGGQGAAPLPTVSGSAPDSLRVSPYMWVELTEPDNPGGFDIEPGDTQQNPRHVVAGDTTTWTWKVTPQQLGAMKLHVDAYIMQGKDATSRVAYGHYDKPVKVGVGWKEYPVNAFLWVLTNPGKSMNWLLPGGGGAAIFVAVLAWWKKRKKGDSSPTP